MVDQKAPGIPGQLGWERLQSGVQIAKAPGWHLKTLVYAAKGDR